MNKFLIIGTGGVGGSIAGFLCFSRKGRNVHCPWQTPGSHPRKKDFT